jgi:trans-aconitate methyltransferase
MVELPDAKTYEKELMYMPYKESLLSVLDYICRHVPENRSLVDLMCGPGYLLGKIAEERPDLRLLGVDNDKRYIEHSRELYTQIDFVEGDVLVWQPEKLYDAVICTGALHHIPYELQEKVIRNMAGMVKKSGFMLISDCYINDFADEIERKEAASELGYEYLKETTLNGAPKKVILETAAIWHNDVKMEEFKTSIKKRQPVFEKYFNDVKTRKIWPLAESGYGDYITVLRIKG